MRLAPVSERERVEVIDVLRGFALFGIIAANMRGFNAPAEVYMDPARMWPGWTDRFVQGCIDTLVSGKFVTIFAVLFGMGFAIQLERAEQKGARFGSYYVWRLAILLAIGLAHGLLVWWGDILAAYAVIGILLLSFRKSKQRTLLIWVVVLACMPVAGFAGMWIAVHCFGGHVQIGTSVTQQEIARAIAVYRRANFGEMLRLRVHEWNVIDAGPFPFVSVFVLTRFLFGMYVWRSGFVRNLAAHTGLLRRICVWGCVAGLVANAAEALIEALGPAGIPTSIAKFLLLALSMIGTPTLSAFYAAGIALLTLSPRWERYVAPLGAVGRTALSNYLLQSVVCTALFYGYGLGLYGRFGPAVDLIPTVAVYGLEIPLSVWWLRHFRFGPVEWLWRCGAYRAWQPMRVR